MTQYNREKIPFTPQEMAGLWHETPLSSYFYMRDVFAQLKKTMPERFASDAHCWAIVAGAAYRAGRLSMWQDCRKAKRKAPARQRA